MRRAAALLDRAALARGRREGRGGGERESEREREKRRTERQRNRDEIVKSVERLKIIQGSALRADALAALTCPHFIRVLCPYNAAISRRPCGARQSEDLRVEGLWDRLFSQQIL